MSAVSAATSELDEFIRRWEASGASERANYQLFLTQLCHQLGVPEPEPSGADDERNAYVFERNVRFQDDDGESLGRIDLYKRGCFVLEAKQGSDAAERDAELAQLAGPAARKPKKKGTAVRGTAAWDEAMIRARGQADRYARALPVGEGWPPFLVVVDVGHSIELYSDFTRSGKTYVPFPDPQSFRLKLADLREEKIRARLRALWVDPLALDPSRHAAQVTRELAQRLAALAKLLENQGHDAARAARFTMRCLFTMFAEDVELIPRGAFRDLLGRLRAAPETFQPMVEELWRAMNEGSFSTVLAKKLLKFNGGLFAEPEALPLNRAMLDLLYDAATADWAAVEPAIFGTLLERALDPVERHKLGAHYTPRAYVERLVMPTIIEPLRDDWNAAYAAAITAARGGDLEEARGLVRKFHEQLCETRVLDPACGSGNFLYVTLEHMKRLEGEVLNALREFGDQQKVLLEVDPHQFLGIEVNPRAAAIAELVLWIGYLQWHFRTRGSAQPAEPIIKNYRNIECRDALLAWDRTEPVLDAAGLPVTRWDGRTTKPHPVTGEEVPDDAARVPVVKYVNPRKAEWPKADYVVGNPPFIGTARMRDALGDGYTEAIRATYKELPESCDFVMYWWNNAAELICSNALKQFGYIATNSLRQTFNRRILSKFLTDTNDISLSFAIPDHPWVDSDQGADVRISMTVASPTKASGKLVRVLQETPGEDEATLSFGIVEGRIQPDLTVGAEVSKTGELLANSGLSNRGFCLFGAGFIVSQDQARDLGLGKLPNLEKFVRHYRNGRDLASHSREVMVIDLFGLEPDHIRSNYPEVFQWVSERVKPERDVNPRKSRRDNWWIFGEPNAKLRVALAGLERYIATVETSKHRFFTFLDKTIAPDNMLVTIALEDAHFLGVLSSAIHVTWALAAGGRLGVGNDPRYNKSRCFEPFPFPDCTDAQKSRIRELAEQLDAHRKRQQALHPRLTLTEMYNVLEKLRAGEALSEKEKKIHEQGLVSVLRQIHDELDAAVADAYGWPAALADEEILERLVALNAERAAEEARGQVRWLRPEFQNPSGAAAVQKPLALADDEPDEDEAPAPRKTRGKAAAATKPLPKPKTAGKAAKRPWPAGLDAQAKALLEVLRAQATSLTPAELAAHFHRAPRDRVAELLQTLAALGQARRRKDRYRV